MFDDNNLTKNEEQNRHAENADEKSQRRDYKSLLFRPFPFIECIYSAAHRENTRHQKRQYYTETMGKYIGGFADNSVGFGRWLFSRRNSNAWIAFFTFVLTVASIYQWIAMRDQNAIMVHQSKQTEETLELLRNEQRPWIGVIEPKPSDLRSSKGPRVEMLLNNSGITPAKITAIIADDVVIDTETGVGIYSGKPLSAHVQEALKKLNGSSSAGRFVIPPKVTSTGKLIHIGGKISEEAAGYIHEGTYTLYVFGGIRYGGTSENPWITEFCFRFDGDEGFMSFHDEYNDMK